MVADQLSGGLEESSSGAAKAPVVILVHGIRDFALWQSNVRAALEEEGFKIEATNYGRLNVLQFLLPFPYFRKQASETVWNQIRIIKQNNETSPLSIIAHSFGTYVIAHLMREKFDVKFHRVIFCGSVVRYDFPFEQFQNRFSPPIVNEVGTRDIWPAIAESVTVGYGSAGTYGFRRPLVRDRWHNGAHHGFFLNTEFCKKFWVPFLRDGTIVAGSQSPEPPRLWIQLFTIVKIKVALAVMVLVLAFGSYFFDATRDIFSAFYEYIDSYSDDSKATFSDSKSSKILEKFLRPDGLNVDRARVLALQRCMSDQGLTNSSLTLLLRSTEYNAQRSACVKALQLE